MFHFRSKLISIFLTNKILVNLVMYRAQNRLVSMFAVRCYYMCLSVHRNAMLPGMGNFLHEIKLLATQSLSIRTVHLMYKTVLFLFLLKKTLCYFTPVNN